MNERLGMISASGEAPVRNRFWLKTTVLMWSMVVLIAVLAILLPMYAAALNLLGFLGFPLGFYMAAQGSLLGLAAVVFLFVRRQDRIDARGQYPESV